MSVNRGIFPPSRSYSLSFSRSRGSNAILLPPSNAEPACAVRPAEVMVPFPGGECGRRSSSEVDELAPTLRRESPVEAIASRGDANAMRCLVGCTATLACALEFFAFLPSTGSWLRCAPESEVRYRISLIQSWFSQALGLSGYLDDAVRRCPTLL